MQAVKFMWGLFACNELLFRRFNRGENGECACCIGEAETPWHVVGECGDAQAAALRGKWADRMWAEVSAELARSRRGDESRWSERRSRRRHDERWSGYGGGHGES